MARSSPRIELDQENPTVNQVVTFTVQAKGATEIRLVIGERAAFWPPVGMDQDVTGGIDESYTLHYPGTAVAWLLKNDVAVAGTIFAVTE